MVGAARPGFNGAWNAAYMTKRADTWVRPYGYGAQPGVSLPPRRRDACATSTQAGRLCYQHLMGVGGEGLGEGVGASGP